MNNPNIIYQIRRPCNMCEKASNLDKEIKHENLRIRT